MTFGSVMLLPSLQALDLNLPCRKDRRVNSVPVYPEGVESIAQGSALGCLVHPTHRLSPERVLVPLWGSSTMAGGLVSQGVALGYRPSPKGAQHRAAAPGCSLKSNLNRHASLKISGLSRLVSLLPRAYNAAERNPKGEGL